MLAASTAPSPLSSGRNSTSEGPIHCLIFACPQRLSSQCFVFFSSGPHFLPLQGLIFLFFFFSSYNGYSASNSRIFVFRTPSWSAMTPRFVVIFSISRASVFTFFFLSSPFFFLGDTGVFLSGSGSVFSF